MKTLNSFIVLFLFFCSIQATNISHYAITDYTVKDGLGHGLVNDIIQDRQGLLWFATWNGLSCFDGYRFKNYKSYSNDKVIFSNDRILSLKEDSFGFLWILCYDNSVYRFDPTNETFIAVETLGDQENFVAIEAFSSGVVWLKKNDGTAVRVFSDLQTRKLSINRFPYLYKSYGVRKINRVYQDKSLQEWILTDNGIYSLESVKHILAKQKQDDSRNVAFYSIIEKEDCFILGSEKGNLWKCHKGSNLFWLKRIDTQANIVDIRRYGSDTYIYVTDTDGFFIEKGQQIIHVCKENYSKLPDDKIHDLYIDGYGLIWINHSTFGISMFDIQKNEVTYFLIHDEYGNPLMTETGAIVFEDKNDILWIHPKGGGFSYYDRENNQLIPFNTIKDKYMWRSNDRCYCATIDRQGNLWLSTQMGGLKKIIFQHNPFQLLSLDNYDINSARNEIRALYVDKEQRIWIGTRNMEIILLDKHKKKLGYLSRSGKIVQKEREDIKIGKVYNIFQDNKGIFWLSTKGNGIFRLQPQSDGGFAVEHYCYDNSDKYSLSNDNVYFIFQDSFDRIWVATYGGGINLIEKRADGKIYFINYRNRLSQYPIDKFYKVRHITEDSHKRIWISTTSGLLMFDASYSQPEEISFSSFCHMADQRNSLSNNDVHMTLCLENGQIFAATYGGGMTEIINTETEKITFKNYSARDGLVADIVYAIYPDTTGHLWLVTEKGVIKFSLSEKTFEYYENEFFMFNIQFSEGIASYSEGEILIGTNRGLFYFSPENIFKNTFIPPIYFSSLQLDDKVLSARDSSCILINSINACKSVKIPHSTHMITIKFAALDMSDTENILYAYKLEGFDKEFRTGVKRQEAIYTNLPHGKYVFHLKSTNSEGVWVDNERTLAIEILPSFWETPYAFVLYVLIFLSLLSGGTYILFFIFKLKHKVFVEQQISDLKIQFFTNISHELRTPLTLIEGPIEYILKHLHINEDVNEQLIVVQRNTQRMLRLINQILDFSKIQNNKMKLCVELVDIVFFTRRIMENFQALSKEKQIDFKFESSAVFVDLWVDKDKFEKIIFNLLSNAFKYTKPNKSITVFVREGKNIVTVGVKDQGIGISDSRKKTLFIRFENLFDKNNSSGIGLSFVKELADMHHASIYVESKVGEGSCFSINFKKGRKHFGKDVDFVLDDDVQSDNSEEEMYEDGGESDFADIKTMLIIEDNQELRSFLRNIFSVQFRIIEAPDGKKGLEKAVTCIPDIIISDIMMPEKDGIELITELRENLATSHIPVIVLTAKTDMETKLQSIKGGADSYITKPFSVSYLETRVNNLLARRKELQTFFCSHDLKKVNEVQNESIIDGLNDKDREFLIKLNEIMEREISNPDLSVDLLVENFNFSRTIFFGKLKSLTGKSPIMYIKEMRMNKAVQLLNEHKYSIAEVAYRVGFNDPHYFSKSFKLYFGVSPSEY